MKFKIPLAAPLLVGALWAQNQMQVQGVNPAQFLLSEISKIDFTSSNAVFHLSNGSSASYALAGQKWTWGAGLYSSAISSSAASVNAGNSSSSVQTFVLQEPVLNYQVHGSRLSVRSDQDAQFRLLGLNGQIWAKSAAGLRNWEADLNSQTFILQVQTSVQTRQYLVQSMGQR